MLGLCAGICVLGVCFWPCDKDSDTYVCISLLGVFWFLRQVGLIATYFQELGVGYRRCQCFNV